MRTTAKMGLTSWDQPTDPYNYAQLAANWQTLDFHDHSPGRGTPVAAGGLAPGAVLPNSIAAGVVGLQHLSPTVLNDLGLNWGTNIGRGAVNIPTLQTTTSATATLLATPDTVQNVVLNTNGIIMLDYFAMWKVSVSGQTAYGIPYLTPAGGSASYVLDGSGLSAQLAAGIYSPPSGTTYWRPLYTIGNALSSFTGTMSSDSPTPVTTGQTVGGATMMIYAAAGTYNVDMRFQVTGGATVSVQNRRMWVRTVNF